MEEFGTEVLKVREIMGSQDITTIPQVPPYVKGVINLRGKVIPVVDLRLKFAMDAQEYTARTCIIVMRTRQAEEELMIGMIVDGVVEVLNLTASDIEDTPDFGPGVVTPYLTGMAKIKGKVKILLDIDQVLGQRELQGLSGTAAIAQHAPGRFRCRAHLAIGCRHIQRRGSMLELAANVDPALLTDQIDELSTRLILDGVAAMGPADFDRLSQSADGLRQRPTGGCRAFDCGEPRRSALPAPDAYPHCQLRPDGVAPTAGWATPAGKPATRRRHRPPVG